MMSDEQQDTTEDIVPYRLAPVPYELFDAVFDQFFRESPAYGVKAIRKNRSSGSCEYIVTLQGRSIGAIFLRCTQKRNTLIKLIPASEDNRQVRMQILLVLLSGAWLIHQATEDEATGHWVDEPPTTEVDTQIHALYADLLPSENGPHKPRRRPTTNEPPARNAPIDDWLDWRETELERGRGKHSVSFRRLSEQSIYSEDQLSRRSRLRQKSR